VHLEERSGTAGSGYRTFNCSTGKGPHHPWLALGSVYFENGIGSSMFQQDATRTFAYSSLTALGCLRCSL